MSGPEDNPDDDIEPTKEEYEEWERARDEEDRINDKREQQFREERDG